MARGSVPGVGQVDLPTRTGLLALAARLEDRVGRGLEVDKKATDTLYWATDTKRLWLYDGTGWIIMSEPLQTVASPTLANLTLGNGTVSLKYQRSDGWCDVFFEFVMGSTSAVGTTPTVTLPVNASSANAITSLNIRLFESGVNTKLGVAIGNGFDKFFLFCVGAAGTYGELNGITATTPFSWGAADEIVAHIRYPMQSKYS